MPLDPVVEGFEEGPCPRWIPIMVCSKVPHAVRGVRIFQDPSRTFFPYVESGMSFLERS